MSPHVVAGDSGNVDILLTAAWPSGVLEKLHGVEIPDAVKACKGLTSVGQVGFGLELGLGLGYG